VEVWKLCVNFGQPSVMLILNKTKVKRRVIYTVLGEISSIKCTQ